jgi:DNA-binding NtrC family response regulator
MAMSLREPTPEHPPRPSDVHSVLIADDDDGLRDQLAAYLENHGIHCLLAKDGVQALELVKAQRPEVVLLDVCLPQMSGIEVAKRLNRSIPCPKIILMSGYDDAVSEARRAEFETFAVIEKPVPLWSVARALDQAFGLVA